MSLRWPYFHEWPSLRREIIIDNNVTKRQMTVPRDVSYEKNIFRRKELISKDCDL